MLLVQQLGNCTCQVWSLWQWMARIGHRVCAERNLNHPLTLVSRLQTPRK